MNVDLPTAWSAKVLQHVFRHEPFEAIHALARIIGHCGRGNPVENATLEHPSATTLVLNNLRSSIRDLRVNGKELPGLPWLERIILLGLACRARIPQSRTELAAHASWRSGSGNCDKSPFDPTRRTIIIAGACNPDYQALIEKFGHVLGRACEGLEFDFLSGGTCSGVSGLAGKLAVQSGGRIRGFGYLPGSLPAGVQEDRMGFPLRFRLAASDGFSPMEPLQGWTDLVTAGLAPEDVRVLCYAPGSIASVECVVALALGARVGLIDDPALPQERCFDVSSWKSCANLFPLPLDAMTVRAFLQNGCRPPGATDQARLESAARMTHDDYLQSAPSTGPPLQQWDDLDTSLKSSNYQQIAYWEQALHDYGLGIRPLSGTNHHVELPRMEALLGRQDADDLILAMAEMEHGRWNVERLACGWRYAPEKDSARKLSPWIVPWDKVPVEIQQYDIDAILSLPVKFRQAGLEIHQP